MEHGFAEDELTQACDEAQRALLKLSNFASGEAKLTLISASDICKSSELNKKAENDVTYDGTLFHAVSRPLVKCERQLRKAFEAEFDKRRRMSHRSAFTVKEKQIALPSLPVSRFFNVISAEYTEAGRFTCSLSAPVFLALNVGGVIRLTERCELDVCREPDRLIVRQGQTRWITSPLENINNFYSQALAMKMLVSTSDGQKNLFIILPPKAIIPFAAIIKNKIVPPVYEIYSEDASEPTRPPMVVVETDKEFQRLMSTNQNTVLVVIVHATWCHLSQTIGPHFKKVAETFPTYTFVSIDVDKCKRTAQSIDVTVCPTFVVFHKGQLLSKFFATTAENLRTYISNAVQSDVRELDEFIDNTKSQVSNEDGTFNLPSIIDPTQPINSRVSASLVLNIVFKQAVKVHSIQIEGPGEEAPKHVKLYVNLPVTCAFDHKAPVQTLDLSESSLQDVRLVKFQNVQNLQIFVENNKGGNDKTSINKLKIFGTPVNGVTNMNSFEGVSDMVGEIESL